MVNLPTDVQLGRELIQAKNEYKKLQEEEQELSQKAEKLQEYFNKTSLSETYGEYAFVTFGDIKKLVGTVDNKGKNMVIAKVNPGTIMEVLEPGELSAKNNENIEVESKYQISLKSKSAEIKVYNVEDKPSNDDQNDGQEVVTLINMYE